MSEFTLRQLEYFVAVAEHGAISAAAAALHVSESAVSTALTELERSLGASLAVRRRAHGITLTTDGRQALVHARIVLREARELAMSVGREGLAGPLAVGCYDTLAATVLPRLVRGFSDAHPDVVVTAIDGEQDAVQRQLADGDLDLAILYDRDIEGDPEIAPLFSIRAHVLVAADHPAAAPGTGTVSFRELAEEPFIRFDLNPSWQHTRSLMALEGVVPIERYRTANLEHARSLVGQGLGYTVLVQRPASDVTNDGSRVAVLELEPPVPPVRVVVAWRRGVPLNARAAEFVRFAVAAFAPADGGGPSEQSRGATAEPTSAATERGN